jgi:hypothetical protein
MMFRGYSEAKPGEEKNISRKGPRNCRSLGFARDDKKERVVVRKGWSLEERVVAGVMGGCWSNGGLLE